MKRFVKIVSIILGVFSFSVYADNLRNMEGFNTLTPSVQQSFRTYDDRIGFCNDRRNTNADEYPVNEWLLSLPDVTRKSVMFYHTWYNFYQCTLKERNAFIRSVIDKNVTADLEFLARLFRGDYISEPEIPPWLTESEKEQLADLIKEYPDVFYLMDAEDQVQKYIIPFPR